MRLLWRHAYNAPPRVPSPSLLWILIIYLHLLILNYPSPLLACILLVILIETACICIRQPIFPNIEVFGNGQHWTQARVVPQVLPWQHDIFLFFYIFLYKTAKYSWKISTFNYTTMNFRNIYCSVGMLFCELCWNVKFNLKRL